MRKEFHDFRKVAAENEKLRAENERVKMWLDDALCIVRAMFDTGAPDDALVKAITAYLEGEKRRAAQ